MAAAEQSGTAEQVDERSIEAQVLEFALDGQRYCVDIGTVAEIVDVGELTVIPNAPPGVLGVMDLRGRTTTIVDPKRRFGVAGVGEGKRIIVFDANRAEGADSAGWLVDEVTQVVDVDPETVDEDAAGDDPLTRGLIRRDGGFIIWVEPEGGRGRAA